MKIVVVGCTHAGTAAVVNLKELHPESDITIYEKNDNISFLSCGIALNVGKVIKILRAFSITHLKIYLSRCCN